MKEIDQNFCFHEANILEDVSKNEKKEKREVEYVVCRVMVIGIEKVKVGEEEKKCQRRKERVSRSK